MSMHFFLGQIYQAQAKSPKVAGLALASMETWSTHFISTIKSVHTGLSINNLTFWKPSHIYQSEASKLVLRHREDGHQYKKIPVKYNTFDHLQCRMSFEHGKAKRQQSKQRRRWTRYLEIMISKIKVWTPKSDHHFRKLWIANKRYAYERQSASVFEKVLTLLYVTL